MTNYDDVSCNLGEDITSQDDLIVEERGEVKYVLKK